MPAVDLLSWFIGAVEVGKLFDVVGGIVEGEREVLIASHSKLKKMCNG